MSLLLLQHLRVDYSQNWGSIDDLPADESLSMDEKQRIWDSPVTIEDAGHHRSFFSQSKDNMILQADDATLGEQASIETCGLLAGSEWRAAPGAWKPGVTLLLCACSCVLFCNSRDIAFRFSLAVRDVAVGSY